MKIGYVRTSADEQSSAFQKDALRAAGCAYIFADDGISGGTDAMSLDGFREALDSLEPGATLCVWKLDRLGRSLSKIVSTIESIKALDVEFVSLSDDIDTTTVHGRTFWQITSMFAELERGLIQERIREGLAAAKSRGKRLGRPPALTPDQIIHARREIEAGRETRGGMARLLGVDRGTLRRALVNANAKAVT